MTVPQDQPDPVQEPKLGGPQDVFYSRDNSVPLPTIARCGGIFLWDEDGNEYIDVSSGPVVSNIGHGNERVADAISRQIKTMDFAYSRVARHRPNIELTKRIAELAGPGYERVFLASGGSEALEIAIKFLRRYVVAVGRPKKQKIISCHPSYHGSTLAMLGMGGDETIADFLEGMAEVSTKVPAPLSYRLPRSLTRESYELRCAESLDNAVAKLGAENVLAFVVEPVGGLATGCLVPSPQYFRHVRDICDRRGIYLVFDEVLCGAGRTGRFLAAHHWPDALPDIVVLAKGLGAGYAPLGAMLAPAAMVDHLSEIGGFNFSHTYSANPAACAAGIAVLEEYRRLDLIGRAAQVGTYLRKGLENVARRSSIVGDVRGLGLLMAVELVADKAAKTCFPPNLRVTETVRIHGLRNGLMIYARRMNNGKFGDWFIVAPPLTITEAECDVLLMRLSKTLRELERSLADHRTRPIAPAR